MKNEHVKEILSIMAENGKDTAGLTALLNYVTSMEDHLNKAYAEVQTIRHELSGLREEHNHPVKSLLQTIETNLNEAAKNLSQLKVKIIDGCKDAVNMFKQKGISALNSMAHFFRVKPTLKAMQDNMKTLIKNDLSSIAKIETISAESHAVSRHLKNIVRAYIGKEPIQDVQPNGKITQMLTNRYRSEIESAANSLDNIQKAIARLDRLERAATLKESADNAVASTESTGNAVIAAILTDHVEAQAESVNKPVELKEPTEAAVTAEKFVDKTEASKESANKATVPKKSADKAEKAKTPPKKAVSSKASAKKTSQPSEKVSAVKVKASSVKKSVAKAAPLKKSVTKPSVVADLAKHVEQVKNAKIIEPAKISNRVQKNPEL